MWDGVFVALAEQAVRFVDEKYGRVAAWFAAAAAILLPIALICIALNLML
jgi:hypothetical protein